MGGAVTVVCEFRQTLGRVGDTHVGAETIVTVTTIPAWKMTKGISHHAKTCDTEGNTLLCYILIYFTKIWKAIFMRTHYWKMRLVFRSDCS